MVLTPLQDTEVSSSANFLYNIQLTQAIRVVKIKRLQLLVITNIQVQILFRDLTVTLFHSDVRNFFIHAPDKFKRMGNFFE